MVEKVTKIRFPTKHRRETRREAPPALQIWAEHRHGKPPSPARSPLAQGSGEAGQLGCTVPSAAQPTIALAVAWRHAKAV
jgi:hypothetical protein